MMSYSDFVPDANTRYNLGFVQIALIGTQVLPSLILMIISSVKSVKLVWKKVYARFCHYKMQKMKHAASFGNQADPAVSTVKK